MLYYLFVKQYSTTRLAAIRGQSDRNIRKLRMTIQKKLQKRMYEHLSEKQEKDYSICLLYTSQAVGKIASVEATVFAQSRRR